MSDKAKSRRVLVTAGAAGIGRVIARSFLQQGDRVAVCDLDEAALRQLRADHPEIVAEKADMADEAAVGGFVRRAVQAMGGLDIVVNNAGVAGPSGVLEAGDPKAIRQCIEVGLLSQFWTLRHALPVMKTQKSGLVVNLSSTAGIFGYPLRTPYAAAKWGVVGLTKSLAMEVGPYGIRVNAICPGSVTGERMERVIAAEARARGTTPEEIYRSYLKGVSLKTFVSPEELAAMIHYLASPAGRAITGQALAIDGGTETLAAL
mgnify:CR=1 FL=1